MSRLKRIVLAVSLVAGFASGLWAQSSAGRTGTGNVTIVKDERKAIVVNHAPFFGLGQVGTTTSVGFSGSAAKMPANLAGGNVSVLASSEPGYEVNVCISLTSEMVSRDGSGDKLLGGVYLANSNEAFSNRTTAQLSGSDGKLEFLVSAMSPDASSENNGSFGGAIDVILTYN